MCVIRQPKKGITTMKLLSNLMRTLVVAGVLVPTTAYAGHWDLPSCYIDVHSGCYVNTTSPCTDAEYKDFLRMCHDTYPNIGGTNGKKKLKLRN
jgi:hypothetical protein